MSANVSISQPKVQLFAQNPNTLQWIELDLISQDPILVTLSVQDMFDLTRAGSDYTQSFRLNHTSINGQFFMDVFNVNGSSFNASLVVPAYININGTFFRKGNFHLETIYENYRDDTYEYGIVFYGQTADFSTKIGQAGLNLVNLSANYYVGLTSSTPNIGGTVFGNNLGHTFSLTNIVTSWGTTGSTSGGGLPTPNGNYGDVLYPLIEWGYDYNQSDDIVAGQASISYGYANSFSKNLSTPSTDTPLSYKQFKPAIRAKAIWDAIFLNSGYTYTSNFLNSSDFLKQYVVCDSTARATIEPLNFFNVIGGGLNLSNGTAFPQSIPFVSAPLNDNNVFNPAGNFFLVPVGGTYSFFIDSDNPNLPCFKQVAETVNPVVTTFSLIKNYGTPAAATIYSIGATAPPNILADCLSATTAPALSSNFISVSLAAGDTVSLWMDVNTNNLSCIASTYGQQHYYSYPVRWGTNNEPDGFSMNSFLPSEKLQIDFIKSIADRFKLVFIPDYTNPNNFTVEPWQDWIAGDTTIKDWTYKLDNSKDFAISPIFYTQKRGIEFIDPVDQDYVNYNYTQAFKYPYGYTRYDSGIQLLSDMEQVQGMFSPTPLAPVAVQVKDLTSSQWLVPHICKFTGVGSNGKATTTGKLEPIKSLPRLLYYGGTVSVKNIDNGSGYKWTVTDTDHAVGPLTFDYYPLVSTFSSWGPTAYSGVNANTIDLNWQSPPLIFSPTYELLGPLTDNVTATNNSFSKYWQTWYNAMHDPYGRIATGYFKLDTQDILNLKFNDRIWIRNAYWYVTKIYDYPVGDVANVKVDLIKISNFNIQDNIIPPAPPCVCVKWTITNNTGSPLPFSYQDCNGTTITFQIYPGETQYPCISTSSSVSADRLLESQSTDLCNCTPSCSCFTWSINNPNEAVPQNIHYIDCSGNTITTSVGAGLTIYICDPIGNTPNGDPGNTLIIVNTMAPCACQ